MGRTGVEDAPDGRRDPVLVPGGLHVGCPKWWNRKLGSARLHVVLSGVSRSRKMAGRQAFCGPLVSSGCAGKGGLVAPVRPRLSKRHRSLRRSGRSAPAAEIFALSCRVDDRFVEPVVTFGFRASVDLIVGPVGARPVRVRDHAAPLHAGRARRAVGPFDVRQRRWAGRGA